MGKFCQFTGGFGPTAVALAGWQRPNGQEVREKGRGSAVHRARKGRCQAEAQLQTGLEKGSAQSVGAFS